ncbi:hypothetical protein [Algoriphagus boseongensis]|nr:hypothetical protein [Algoriphagus boseongensis]
MKLLFSSILILFSSFPVENHAAIAQQNNEVFSASAFSVTYNHLVINKLNESNEGTEISLKEELNFEPLTIVEEKLAKSLNSHWVWPEYTLDMIDSYSPFLFRTKKSQAIEEVSVLLQVNSKGEVSGFKILSEVDKGLHERLDYVIRKLPSCKPVPGFSSYSPTQFELIIKK